MDFQFRRKKVADARRRSIFMGTAEDGNVSSDNEMDPTENMAHEENARKRGRRMRFLDESTAADRTAADIDTSAAESVPPTPAPESLQPVEGMDFVFKRGHKRTRRTQGKSRSKPVETAEPTAASTGAVAGIETPNVAAVAPAPAVAEEEEEAAPEQNEKSLEQRRNELIAERERLQQSSVQETLSNIASTITSEADSLPTRVRGRYKDRIVAGVTEALQSFASELANAFRPTPPALKHLSGDVDVADGMNFLSNVNAALTEEKELWDSAERTGFSSSVADLKESANIVRSGADESIGSAYLTDEDREFLSNGVAPEAAGKLLQKALEMSHTYTAKCSYTKGVCADVLDRAERARGELFASAHRRAFRHYPGHVTGLSSPRMVLRAAVEHV